jgi:hypothetical protein
MLAGVGGAACTVKVVKVKMRGKSVNFFIIVLTCLYCRSVCSQ